MQQANGSFLNLFYLTLQLEQTDQGNCAHCNNEDEEQLRSCDQEIQETHTSWNRDVV